MENIYDVIIVGGGASGIMAAIEYATIQYEKKLPSSVLIIEKNSRIGRKILISGNGKCNIGNAVLTDNSYNNMNFYKNLAIPSAEYIDYFSKLGLLIKTYDNGLMYPYSELSSSVLDVLLERLRMLNVDIITEKEVINIKKIASLAYDNNTLNDTREPLKTSKSIKCKINQGNNDQYNVNDNCKNRDNREVFRVDTHDNVAYYAHNIVISSGSPAYSGTDSTSLAIKLGHSVSPFIPSLTPLNCDKTSIMGLDGVRIKCKASIYKIDTGSQIVINKDFYNKDKSSYKPIHSLCGEILFKKDGISGILAMQLSRFISRECLNKYYIELDLFEGIDLAHLVSCLKYSFTDCKLNKKDNMHMGIAHKMIFYNIFKMLDISNPQYEDISIIAHMLKRYPVINPTLTDYTRAQIAVGGIYTQEIDNKSMESKIVKNLYIIGELLDIDGDTGGYNLQYAIMSGILAGRSIAQSLG